MMEAGKRRRWYLYPQPSAEDVYKFYMMDGVKI